MNGNLRDVEQRRKIRRKKARKKHLTVLGIALLVLSLTVFSLLSITVLFPIKTVNAKNSGKYSGKEIIKAAQINGKNIFTFGTQKTENNIRKKLPYADSIEFSRQFPDTVNITVKDATEYANYLSNGKYYTVSQKGYILAVSDEANPDLLTISSSEVKGGVGEKLVVTNEKETEIINQVTRFFEKSNLRLNTFDVTNINDIKATVMDKYDVEFGTKTYLDKKCSHLKGMLNNMEENSGGTINLSMWTPQKSEGTFIKNNAE